MLDLFGEPGSVLLIGGFGGFLLGLAARLGKFCTLGMIEDVHYGHDFGRMWMWVTALGVAIFANHLAHGMGWIDLGQTVLLSHTVFCPWRNHRWSSVRVRNGTGWKLRLRRARTFGRRRHSGIDDCGGDGRDGQRHDFRHPRAASCGVVRRAPVTGGGSGLAPLGARFNGPIADHDGTCARQCFDRAFRVVSSVWAPNHARVLGRGRWSGHHLGVCGNVPDC